MPTGQHFFGRLLEEAHYVAQSTAPSTHPKLRCDSVGVAALEAQARRSPWDADKTFHARCGAAGGTDCLNFCWAAKASNGRVGCQARPWGGRVNQGLRRCSQFPAGGLGDRSRITRCFTGVLHHYRRNWRQQSGLPANREALQMSIRH